MKLLNIIEHNGEWHKCGEDGNCAKFTMQDLKGLLKEKEKETLEFVIYIINKKLKEL